MLNRGQFKREWGNLGQCSGQERDGEIRGLGGFGESVAGRTWENRGWEADALWGRGGGGRQRVREWECLYLCVRESDSIYILHSMWLYTVFIHWKYYFTY